MKLALFVSNSRVWLRWYYWQKIKAIQNFMNLAYVRNIDSRVEIPVQTKM